MHTHIHTQINTQVIQTFKQTQIKKRFSTQNEAVMKLSGTDTDGYL